MLKLLLAMLAISGGSMTAAATPVTGQWGGDRATLTLTATGGSFVEDCASATIDGPAQGDARGGFTATGHREVYTPGPQQADVAPPIDRVRFVGRATPSGLLLEIHEAGGAVHSYRLAAGRRIKPVRCL